MSEHLERAAKAVKELDPNWHPSWAETIATTAIEAWRGKRTFYQKYVDHTGRCNVSVLGWSPMESDGGCTCEPHVHYKAMVSDE